MDSLAHFLEYVFGEVMMGVIQEMLLILERSGVPVTYEALDALVRSSLVLFALFLAFLIVGIVIGWVIRLSWNLGTDIGNDIIKYRKYPALKTVDFIREDLKKRHKIKTHHSNFYLGSDGTIRLEVEGKRPLPSAEDLSLTLRRLVEVEQDYRGRHVIVVGPAAA